MENKPSNKAPSITTQTHCEHDHGIGSGGKSGSCSFSSSGINGNSCCEHAMQLVGVTAFLLTAFHYTSVLGAMTFVCTLFSPFCLIAFGYLFWYYKTSDHAFKGGYNVKYLRNLNIWRHFRNYFPVKVVRTQELDNTKNYIIGVHPAGVLNVGSMSLFGTNSPDYQRNFAGITPHLVTNLNRFVFPITRELLLFSGISADDPKTFDWVLNNRGLWSKRGQAMIVPLGSCEELVAQRPGQVKLFFKGRKDVIRAALKTGSSLVPCFQFGETELYGMNQSPCPQGGMISRCVQFVRNIMVLPLSILSSQTMNTECCGILPKSSGINVVFGRPIDLKKVDYPTEEQVQQVLEQYCKELENIFNEHKNRFLDNKNSTLVIQ
jgi:hypothetical protein